MGFSEAVARLLRVHRRPVTSKLQRVVFTVTLSLWMASQALATNHLTRFDELLVGAFGDPDVQFIEITFRAMGQNLWGPQGGEIESRALLNFHNASGSRVGQFVFSSDPPEGVFDPAKNGFTVLIGTQAWVDLTGLAVDVLIPPLANPVDGMVCFTSNPVNAAFPVRHCLSYGAFVGAQQTDCPAVGINACCSAPTSNGPPAPAFPAVTLVPQSLTRFEDLTDDFECGHENANFRLEDASARNSAGQIFTFDSRAALGEILFSSGTFDGNGRTCATCHTVVDDFALSPDSIASLLIDDPLDPLFIATFDPALSQLENSCLMEGGRALILENIDGFSNDPVFRNSPHLLNIENTAPYGLSGEFEDLRSFSTGAVMQHFTQTMGRTPGVDFTLPTALELEQLEAFMNTIRFPSDGNLDLDRMINFHVIENGADPAAILRGRDLFFGDQAQCSRCHSGATLSDADGSLELGTGNVAFNTGVAQLPQSLVDDGCIGGPGDPNAGLPPEAGGTRLFSTPPLLGVARTAPFFHDHVIGTLQDAVSFYDTAEFRASTAAALLPSEITINFQAILDITAFLEAISVDPADAMSVPDEVVVAVFDNPSFVDTSGIASSESDTVQASLVSFGHTVETFIGITAADFSAAADSSNLILIPELETGNLGAALDASAINELVSFVEGGGSIVVMGSSPGNDLNFINTVFGTSMVRNNSSPITLDAAVAAGTLFEGGAATLPGLSATRGMSRTTLPADTLEIYHSTTASFVWQAPIGSGRIGYLGWDWFEGPPLGPADDGGWLPVLDAMVRTLAGDVRPSEEIDASSVFPLELFGSSTSTIATPLPIALQAAVPGADSEPLIGRATAFDVIVSLSGGTLAFPLTSASDIAVGSALSAGSPEAWTVAQIDGVVGGNSVSFRFTPNGAVNPIGPGVLFEIAANAIFVENLTGVLVNPDDELSIGFEIRPPDGDPIQHAQARVVRAIEAVEITTPSTVAALQGESTDTFYRSEDMHFDVAGVCFGFPNGGLSGSANCVDPTRFIFSEADDVVVVTIGGSGLAPALQTSGAAIFLDAGVDCNPADVIDRFDGPLPDEQTSIELISPVQEDRDFHLGICVTGAQINPDDETLSIDTALEFSSLLLIQPPSVASTMTLEARCFGDFNQDGFVDNADVLVLLGCFPCRGPGCDPQCDANFDGNVNNSDLLSFRQSFGQACGSAGASSATQSTSDMSAIDALIRPQNGHRRNRRERSRHPRGRGAIVRKKSAQ